MEVNRAMVKSASGRTGASGVPNGQTLVLVWSKEAARSACCIRRRASAVGLHDIDNKRAAFHPASGRRGRSAHLFVVRRLRSAWDLPSRHDALHKHELDLAPKQSLQFLVGLHIGKWRNRTMKSDHWIYTVVINNFVDGMEQFCFQSIE
jgi:hypothetical protein